jgi:hypothetical protein
MVVNVVNIRDLEPSRMKVLINTEYLFGGSVVNCLKLNIQSLRPEAVTEEELEENRNKTVMIMHWKIKTSPCEVMIYW